MVCKYTDKPADAQIKFARPRQECVAWITAKRNGAVGIIQKIFANSQSPSYLCNLKQDGGFV